MKTVRIFLSSMVILSILAIVLAEDNKTKDAPATQKKETQLTPEQRQEKNLRKYYDQMAATAGFSESQKAQLSKSIFDYLRTKKAWKAENESKLTELNKKLAEARTASDKDTEIALRNQLKPIHDQKETIWRMEGKLGFAIMTDAQRLKYESSLLQRGVLRNYKDVKLTEGQLAALGKLSDVTAAEVISLGEDWHKISKVRRRLKLDTYGNIMTAQQRTEYEASKLKAAANTKYRKAKLSEAQIKKFGAMTTQFGQKIAAAQARRTKRDLNRRFLLEVYDNILTQEQKSKVTPPRERRPKPKANK